MDDRQRQIREGAGLEESKLNVEFIDWLKKWGPYFVITLAAVVLIWRGWEFLKSQRQATLDKAFIEHRQLTSGLNPSPESLVLFADTHKATPGLAAEARLEAARIYLQAVGVGIEPGAQPAADGTFKESDLLSDARRVELLNKAESLYSTVLSNTEGKVGMELMAVQAAFGLASVAESREDWAEASQNYEQVIAIATAGNLPTLAEVAVERREALDTLKTLPKYYSQADLPEPPPPPTPTPVPVELLPGGPQGPSTPPTAPTTPPADPPAQDPPAQDPPANPPTGGDPATPPGGG